MNIWDCLILPASQSWSMTCGDVSKVVHRVMTFVMKCLCISQEGKNELANLLFSFSSSWKRSFSETKAWGIAVVQPGQSSQLCRRTRDPEWRLFFACMYESAPDISSEVSCILTALHLPYACSFCPSFHPGLPLIIPPSSQASRANEVEAFLRWTNPTFS